MNYNILATI